jgi:hypothetical protein
VHGWPLRDQRHECRVEPGVPETARQVALHRYPVGIERHEGGPCHALGAGHDLDQVRTEQWLTAEQLDPHAGSPQLLEKLGQEPEVERGPRALDVAHATPEGTARVELELERVKERPHPSLRPASDRSIEVRPVGKPPEATEQGGLEPAEDAVLQSRGQK